MSGLRKEESDRLDALFAKHDSELKAALRGLISPRERVLIESARALLAKMEALEPTITAAVGVARVHGWRWPADKEWKTEMDNIRAALTAYSTQTEGDEG